ncbi:MAG: hypothetical protein EPO07_09465 [Verrucomicrobia bacterium]|nr:MAG: hypothetical protein EPO07_09465 [Verrucomicrobiota bacterium]
MRCFKHHSTDAVAVCACCGRALCPDCVQTPTATRIVCSSDCANALARDAKAVQLLLDKSAQSAKASAFYCYLTAALSAGASIAAWFMLPSPFLIYFTAACALVLFAAGFWYRRVARKHGLDA